MGGSRKYPYPYHGRHLGIPKGRGGYVDWNSEDMGGFIGLEFRRHGGDIQGKLVKNDLSKDDDSLINTRHVQLNQHAGHISMHSHGQYNVYANMTAESCSLASRSDT